jgi:hypothetical protein
MMMKDSNACVTLLQVNNGGVGEKKCDETRVITYVVGRPKIRIQASPVIVCQGRVDHLAYLIAPLTGEYVRLKPLGLRNKVTAVLMLRTDPLAKGGVCENKIDGQRESVPFRVAVIPSKGTSWLQESDHDDPAYLIGHTIVKKLTKAACDLPRSR